MAADFHDRRDPRRNAEFKLPPGYRLQKAFPPSGMGLVLLVTNETQALNRPEVLKTVNPRKIKDEELLKRFRREAQQLSRIRHPGVVTVYAAGEHEGWPFFTMEYLEGGSLSDRLAAGPLPLRQATVWFARVARALHWIHSQGIAHRDIKPANMLFTKVDGEEQIKLSDFGLAKQLDPRPKAAPGETLSEALTKHWTVLGTPGFIAPELLSDHFLPTGLGDSARARWRPTCLPWALRSTKP
jgi:serine/threonine-protein kinase